jgi:hypothetical protein
MTMVTTIMGVYKSHTCHTPSMEVSQHTSRWRDSQQERLHGILIYGFPNDLRPSPWAQHGSDLVKKKARRRYVGSQQKSLIAHLLWDLWMG